MDDLRTLLAKRILVLDGAMGTAIQALDLPPADFGGAAHDGCNEHLSLTRPDILRGIHAGYLEAGSDIVETNTFGAVRHVLAEYDLADKVREINLAAAHIALDEARKRSTPDKPRFVAGALGPGTKTISVTGGITFDEVARHYEEAARALIEGGVDLLLVETQQDTLNVKATLAGLRRAAQAERRQVPVILSISIEAMGTMLGGQSINALYASVAHHDLLAIGLNCATGPDFMTDHLRALAALSRFPVVCYPNAGFPDEHGRYHESPDGVADKLERFCDEGWINIVGGCCGTTPEHIRLIARMAKGKRPRTPSPPRATTVSGLEALTLEEARRPYLVGERTNVIGSRNFKGLIAKGSYDEAAEVGRRQVRHGAHIVDVCLADPDRDEGRDMALLLDQLVRQVKVPLMIDSTDPSVIEGALKRVPGKAVVNSINLEDGGERLRKVVPLLREYGAAVVVGVIDEDKAQGMAVARERKLAVARRAYGILTERYGIAPEDILFDLLVFPVGTGDNNYRGAARETIEGLRLVKREFPACKTILGISNVSFGLPPAGREVLNAVFLHHCVEAGLDLAIVNAEKLARYASLPGDERRLAEDLLFCEGPGDPAARFSARYRDAAAKAKPAQATLPPEERVFRCIVEGSKEGLPEALDALLAMGRTPLELVNGPLLRGMDEVGRLFAANELIVAEVLQSAEAMKAAVACLEPRMGRAGASTRGRVVLATVKGDVHDIGKNLVHIILKNNGYAVTDLGIQVAPQTLVEAVREDPPDAVGLSGLLVKSAQQMAATAGELRAAGVRAPVLVGGAALSPKFAALRIAPAYGAPVLYAKDAMAGLDFMNRLQDPERRDALLSKNRQSQERLRGDVSLPAAPGVPRNAGRPAPIDHSGPVPTPPDLKLHVPADLRAEEVFAYINPIMLYGKHLGLRGPARALAERQGKAVELERRVRSLQDELAAEGRLRPKAVFRFFPAQAEGDSVFVYDSPSRPSVLETFVFPRQGSGERLCLADFVAPKASDRMDFVAFFAVTCGEGVRELAEGYREAGEYLRSHALQSLAIESAEALAELLHERLRAMWGFPDPAAMTLKEKFRARYRGLRVSFGYPACPDLADQAKLFKLLDPQRHIGVALTEGQMMDPEASVSALVLHHPEARYFSVGDAAGAPGSFP